MKLGIILYSTDAEVVWNAFRLANFSRKEGDQVQVFLLATGVDYLTLSSNAFDIAQQAQAFLNANGELLACGSCLKLRQRNGSDLCPLSTMKDLYELIRDCDKTVSF